MKKIIILFTILLTSAIWSQSFDSTSFELSRGNQGFYNSLVNKVTVNGIAAGLLKTDLSVNLLTLDTVHWQITQGELGFYKYAINRGTWMGKPAGTVRCILSYDISSDTVYYAPNMNGYAYKDSSNTFSKENTFSDDTLKFTGDTNTTFRITKDWHVDIENESGSSYIKSNGDFSISNGTETASIAVGGSGNTIYGNTRLNGDGAPTQLYINQTGVYIGSEENNWKFQADGDGLKIYTSLNAMSENAAYIKTDDLRLNDYMDGNIHNEVTVPASAIIYGTLDALLGQPQKWYIINDNNGNQYLVPAYDITNLGSH